MTKCYQIILNVGCAVICATKTGESP